MSERYDNLSKIISPDTVQRMSELIALSALKKAHCYFSKIAPKLYAGLIGDLFDAHDDHYHLSDGYDVVQVAACYLYRWNGHSVEEVIDTSKNGRPITVKHNCYTEIYRYLRSISSYECNTEVLERTQSDRNAAMPFDVKKEESDDNVDTIVERMQLTDVQKNVLDCFMSGMKYREVAAYLSMALSSVIYRKAQIRQKYIDYIGY